MADGWDDLDKGRICLIFSAFSLSEVILNGVMGIFPGGFIGQGGIGQKFYLFPWISQQVGDWNGQDFWSDSGFLSEQEYAFIVLHILLAYIGLTYLRRGNDSNKDLHLDSDDWTWMKEHSIILSTFVPMGVMWLFVIAIFSIWVILFIGVATILILAIKFEPERGSVQIVSSSSIQEISTQKPITSESVQTISDSVAGGDVVGGDKVVNDPETIAKVAIEAYRRGISDKD